MVVHRRIREFVLRRRIKGAEGQERDVAVRRLRQFQMATQAKEEAREQRTITRQEKSIAGLERQTAIAQQKQKLFQARAGVETSRATIRKVRAATPGLFSIPATPTQRAGRRKKRTATRRTIMITDGSRLFGAAPKERKCTTRCGRIVDRVARTGPRGRSRGARHLHRHLLAEVVSDLPPQRLRTEQRRR